MLCSKSVWTGILAAFRSGEYSFLGIKTTKLKNLVQDESYSRLFQVSPQKGHIYILDESQYK